MAFRFCRGSVSQLLHAKFEANAPIGATMSGLGRLHAQDSDDRQYSNAN